MDNNDINDNINDYNINYSNNDIDNYDSNGDNSNSFKSIKFNDYCLFLSKVGANIEGVNFSDNFSKISANICVEKITTNSLTISIDANDCKVGGNLLSKKCPSLYKISTGYFLDSLKIQIKPIENESIPKEPLYKVKNGPYPRKYVGKNSKNEN